MLDKSIKILRVLLVLLAGIHALAPLTVFADNAIVLPEIGDPSGALLTPSQEQELGAAFFRSVHGNTKVNQDLEIDDFIEELGERLAVNSDNPLQPFRFFVVDDPAINAFAGPGGYIGVNSGLILITESESELASVMAHEIAHVTQRHLYRAFDAARRMTIPAMAAMLAAILIGTQSPELGQAAIIAAQAGSTQYQIDFTRENEQEADRVGMQNLARSTFDPRAMPGFFERLDRSSRYYGEGPPEFLRTHPVTSSRISDTRGRAENFPYRQFLDSTRYLLMKAKLRVMTGIKPSSTIKHFQSELDRGTDTQKAVARYGFGLALAEGGRTAQARTILMELMQQNPDQEAFIKALAELETESGNLESGLKLYTRAIEQFPNSRAIQLDYAEALVQAEKFELARQVLTDYLRNHSPTPDIYALLSRAYDNLGQNGQSNRYLAESYYLSGQTEPAIKQVRIALDQTEGNRYLTALLEDRLKVLLAEEEERKKNEN
ncbi:MAG: M48 family metalloprotease [Methylococcaceae bacterium]|nr:M48 family metalloprotease [Methylococcaceae bacterium]